jgi:quinolinate synthase
VIKAEPTGQPNEGCPVHHVQVSAVNERASCRYMKMITPAALLRSLRHGVDEVHVDPEIAERARDSVRRMVAIGQPGGGE